jgi:hypothetical protein
MEWFRQRTNTNINNKEEKKRDKRIFERIYEKPKIMYIKIYLKLVMGKCL